MKKLVVLLSVLAVAAALAVPALAAVHTVKIGDNYFVRQGAHPTVTMRSGETLRFVWRGRGRHQVYQLSGPIDGTHFHTPTKTSGSYSRVFHKRGIYHFFCTVHTGMKMTLRVK